MPKRTAKDKIEHYRKKIQRLERRRARVIVESSESDIENQIDAEDVELPTAGEEISNSIEIINDIVPEPEGSSEPNQVPELDPDILLALGEPTDESPKFGLPIHDNLAQRWTPILKKGLPKEIKEKIIKDYPIPENCPLLHAPKLNAEISAAITDMSRNRDKKMEASQQELGVGLTAISKALSLLLSSDGTEKIQVIKLLSDGCKTLADLHYVNTKARMKLLTPGLDKSFLNVIKDTDRDETLFGAKLSDKIKASKVIEKQGLQIKKTVIPQKTPAVPPQSTSTRSRYQENWAGPSRYPTNRGGARGGRKTTFNRRTPTTPQNKSSTSSKPRAPTQQ